MNYKVLIVEDDPMVAMINSQFVKKVDGFEVAGMCRNGLEAKEERRRSGPETVL